MSATIISMCASLNSRNKHFPFNNISHNLNLILLLCSALLDHGTAVAQKLSIGGIFEQGSTEIQTAFKYAVTMHNNHVIDGHKNFEFDPCVHVINSTDIFQLTRIMGYLVSRGITPIILGPMIPELFEILEESSIAFEASGIVPWFPQKVFTTMNFMTSVGADLRRAVMDVITFYGWKNIIYLYNSYEGLLRLQSIFQNVSHTDDNSIRIDTVRKIHSVEEALHILLQLDTTNQFMQKYVVLDCPAVLAQNVVIQHVKRQLNSRNSYHYLLSEFAMDDPWELEFLHYGSVNVTGFRIVDPTRPSVQKFLKTWSCLDYINFPSAGRHSISANAALMYDAVSILGNVFSKIYKKQAPMQSVNGFFLNATTNMNYSADTHSVTPLSTFANRKQFANLIRKVRMKGLTGDIQFTEDGRRYNYRVDVMEITTHSSKVKIGEWSDQTGFTAIPAKYTRIPNFSIDPQNSNNNHTYIITTILEGEPYHMKRVPEPGETLTGNDRFMGFCNDLIFYIAEKLGIQYEIRLVKDHKYGKENAKGEWDGMVGEVIRGEADIAIAALTITSAREKAIRFSKPFLSMGISVMVYKPKIQGPGVLSFMVPLSTEIWLCVFLAYIAVSIVLFVVSRFNPNESTEQEIRIHNGPMWFSVAALFQQNSDLSPSSVAGRIAASVWWFFILILIASYTANFAAVRTVNRMVTPINSAEDLAAQTEVEYGTVERGSTWNFFRTSRVQTYMKMWEFMSSRPHVFVPNSIEGIKRVREKKGKYAFLIESPMNEYISERKPCNTMKVGRNLDSKGFGIATAIGSPLTNRIDQAVLSLKEVGTLSQLQKKWWKDRSECPPVDLSATEIDDELSLESLAGIFYVLIVGLLLALIVAGIENCFRVWMETRKSQISTDENCELESHQSTDPGDEEETIFDVTIQKDDNLRGDLMATTVHTHERYHHVHLHQSH